MAEVTKIKPLQPLLLRLINLFEKHAGLMAVLAFAAGLASFLLIERKGAIAQFIAILMLLSWIWLVLDNWLRAGLKRRFNIDISPTLIRFVTQTIHQESLFFVLPFFLAVTSWDHGQAVFTGLIILCAIISITDPIYYKQLAPRPALFVAFHALALFVVLLVVLPLLIQLTTGQSMAAALVVALIFSLPSLGQLLPNERWWRFPVLLVMLMTFAAGLWQLRSWVPPASLRLTAITVSQQLDKVNRQPGENITSVTVDTLKQQGLYAWTAVKAPRGLREKIHHVWLRNGIVVDRITLDIQGGREQGYRAWTHKTQFPPYPAGRWQVQVVTDSGQLIGLTRFTVTKE